MKTIKIVFLLIASLAALPVMADIYMGTASQPAWSPLYPSVITAQPGHYANTPGGNTVLPPVTAQGTSVMPGTVSSNGQFTASYAPSASSFSQTNYAGVAPMAPVQSSVTPYGVMPCQSQQVDMIYGKGPLVPTPCPTAESVLGVRPITYHVTTGSLKANVQRMVRQSGWGQVVWNVPNDYRWTGNITITSTSIQGALSQLLGPYPIQAVFYDTNRIVDIEPRRQA